MDDNVEDVANSVAEVAEVEEGGDTKDKVTANPTLENNDIMELQDDDNGNTTDTIEEPIEQHEKDDILLDDNLPKTESLADSTADTSNIQNTQDVPNHGDNNNGGGDIVVLKEGIDEKTDAQVADSQDVLNGDSCNNLEVETVKDQGIDENNTQELDNADTNSVVSEIEQPTDTLIEDDEGIIEKEDNTAAILNADTNSEVSAINDEPVATEKSLEIDTQQTLTSPISLPPPPIRVKMVQAKTEDGGIIKVPRYEKDMKVQYKSTSGIQGCTILYVHLDDLLVPYYTVRLDDGKEKQTDNAHIVLDENVNKVSQQTPVDDKAEEHLDRQIQFVATQENEEKASNELLDREILFDDKSIINIQVFNAASDKTLSFTTPVLRVSAGRYFWSADVYEKRILAIYKNPDIILVLRLPKDREEVQRLGGNLKAKELSSFLVAENVASPMACKIRLSQLTNATSVPTKKSTEQGLRSSMNEMVANQNDINRKRSCFDLLTPTETVTLSAAFLPPDCFDDIEYTSEKSLNDTHRCEDAIISALVNSHLSSGASPDDTWKHQVILGTLHSYVISGNDHTLKESLSSALAIQQSQSSGGGINKIDPSIIDLKDDSGKTALHYACNRRKNSTVQTLVNFGADCSISQDNNDMTPSHICAQGLDDKILSIVLSATYPVRPNPNALDNQGQTPMYLSAVEGGGSGDSKSNAMALDRCLSALDAWGGQFNQSPKSKDLLHPVHCVSANWRAEELSVILSHCNYRYPLASGNGSSLSAMFQYPIHAALISLRKHIHAVFQTNEDGSMNAEFIPLLPSLVKTVQTLLNHGCEPNERFGGIVGQGDKFKSLSCFFGFTPLQVLALAALDARAIQLTKQELEENDALTLGILRNIMKVIQQLAELLCKNGARINLPPPPPTRLDRPTPTDCYSLKEALDDPENSTLQIGNREELKLDGRDNEIINLLGGGNRLNAAQKAFVVIKSTSIPDNTIKIETTSIDSGAPGGSDSNSCAICWSEFGIISNRKHLCRVSQRYVCNDCSMKRLVVNGSEHRISDGQYLLSISEAKAAARIQANRQDQMKKQRQSVSQARASLGLKSTDGCSSSGDDSSKNELSTQDRISNALSGLGQMKDKVLERGDKLNSLQEKSEALEQASLDFANMAKELNRSQNSWFG